MKTITAAICSYQRRSSLVRLLQSIAKLGQVEVDAFEGLEVLVLLDGSDDGSQEAANAEVAGFPVPLRIEWQPNLGLAYARNACLAATTTELIWFLDDDFVIAGGTVGRHRTAHEHGENALLLGPCLIPSDHTVPPAVERWWNERYAALRSTGKVQKFDQFSIANASGPVALFRTVGGFDESFIGYGLEDYEIGVRMMARGIEEHYDDRAVVWHYTTTNEKLTVERNSDIGSNAVRMARAHPHLRDQLIPADPDRPYWHILARFRFHSTRQLLFVARLACLTFQAVPRRWPHLRQQFFDLASTAFYATGLAREDPAMVRTLLGDRTRKSHMSVQAGLVAPLDVREPEQLR